MLQGNIREAKLRPEFASLYPSLEPGVWLPATTVGQKLLLWHLATAATPQGERLMTEEHFEFRGSSDRPDGLPSHLSDAQRLTARVTRVARRDRARASAGPSRRAGPGPTRGRRTASSP